MKIRLAVLAVVSIAGVITSSAQAGASYPACGYNEDHWATWGVHRHIDKVTSDGPGYRYKDWYSRYYPGSAGAGDLYRTSTYCGL